MKLERIIFQLNRFILPVVVLLFLMMLTSQQFPKTSPAKFLVTVGVKASDLKWLLVLTLTVGCLDLLIDNVIENRLDRLRQLPTMVRIMTLFIAGVTTAALSLGVYNDAPIGLAAIIMFLSTALVLLLIRLFERSGLKQ